MKFWTVRIVVALTVVGLIMPGCASTKNVMNKATFGLIGGSEKSDEQQVASAEQETKAERKAREKEEKQQREAEKRAAKDEEKARKAAEKEEKESDGKPGLMSKMTFGLVGGDKKSDEAKQQEADAKAAEKEQKRQEKQAREEEKRAAKVEKKQLEDEEAARKKEEKLAAKEEKAKEKEAAKVEVTEAQPAATTPERTAEEEKSAAQTASTEEQPKEKRSLMSKMTFGLVGGKKSETEESEPAADASTSSADTASAESTKEEKKEQKRAEKEQREAEKQAAKEAKQAEKEEAKQAKAAEEGATEEQSKEKRTLMSKMTFGLIGGGDKDKSDSGPADETEHSDVSSDSAAPAEPVQPALPPEQLAMAAPADVQYDVQPASAMDAEARKLAKMPFKTTFDLSTKSSTGKGQATASRETYSKNGYGITDIGDVRIAVQDMKFDDESRAGGVIISSDDRLAAGGKSGTGNSLFNYEYAKGVSAVQFGTVSFTIAKSVISIGGKSIPIGQGKKIVLVDGQGNVIGAYDAE